MQKHGPLGVFRVGVRYLGQRLVEVSPARRRARSAELAYDAAHDIDTRGVISLSTLRIDSENWRFGICYQPISLVTFNEAMQSLAIAHERFAFVDLGSGKGRALLLASHYPFRSVSGVEFAPELHAIAEQNIRNYRHPDRRCHAVRSYCADAAAYSLPLDPLVLFVYNAFGPEILHTVLENARSSWISAPRPMNLVYCNPQHAAVVDEAKWLQRLASGPDYIVWRTPDDGAPYATPSFLPRS